MSWTRTLATGSGQLAWRVSIDGWPHEAVSAKSLERTTADGRVRYVGLRMDGLKLSERVELPYAKWIAEGFTVTIADVKKRWTASFAREPKQVTNLDSTTSLNASATTVTVLNTAGFDTSGQVYCDTETIGYTGTTSSTFTTCTRGLWGSVAQYHYNQIGANTLSPEVTDWPRSIEGRRVRLFVYGAGDDHTGSGTQIWVGVAQTDPRFNGVEWEFNVDPLSVIFDTDIGAELEDPRTIRGIYYPVTAPLYLRINERTNGNFATAVTAETEVGLAGFWETQESFCADLNALIVTAMDTTTLSGTFVTPGANLRAEPDGQSWRFALTTPATDERWVNVLGAPTGPLSAVDGMLGPSQPRWTEVNGSLGPETLSASHTYFLRPDSAAGPDSGGTVPRATVGYFDATYGYAHRAVNQSGLDVATNPNGRLYLDGEPSSAVSAVQLDWKANGAGIEASSVDDVTSDATDNYVDLDEHARWWGDDGTSDSVLVATSANPPEIKMQRSLGTGSLADLLTTLVTQTAQYVNTGTAPFIRPTDDEYSSDINVTSDGLAEVRAAADHTAYTSQRVYTLAQKVDLGELVENECRLIGVFPCLDSGGRVIFRRLRLPSPTEVSSGTLTSNTIVVDDQILSYERNTWGLFNTVLISTGYDPVEDEYNGTTYKVRDVAAYGMNPRPRVLEITPKSIDGTTPTIHELEGLASSLLGTFGAPYRTVTIKVPLTKFDVLLGDVVSVTWKKIPASDGTLGVTEKLGLVVGREWHLTEAFGMLTILMTDQRVAGYAPSAKITAITGTSGGTGPFTLTLSADYFRSDQTAEDHFAADYKIRVYRWGSTAAGTVTGTVTSVSDNTMIITTDAAWTYGAITWAVGFQTSDAISAAGQKRYAVIASSTGRITWDDDTTAPAFTFAS